MTEQSRDLEPQIIPVQHVADLPSEQQGRLINQAREMEVASLTPADIVWVFPEDRDATDAAVFLLANVVEDEMNDAVVGGMPPERIVWASLKRWSEQSTEMLNECINTANGDLDAFEAWFRFGSIPR